MKAAPAKRAQPERFEECKGAVRRQFAARIDPGAVGWIERLPGRTARHRALSQEFPLVDEPTHTPYDGSAKLFTIGLKPLELDRWIEVDRHRRGHLAEKRRLYAEIPEKVFVEEDGRKPHSRKCWS